jgi:Uma2 family endonuclease
MAAPSYHEPPVEQILALHEKFESPDGSKAEVIGGQLVVSPSPSRRHGLIFAKLAVQLGRLLPSHLAVTNTITLEMAATAERYIPDLLVVHEDLLRSDEWLLEATHAELVAEIASPSNARQDRVTKVRGYAASGVPIYLLVDPLEQSVTLFAEPAGETYKDMHKVAFGASIELPAPYQGKIDTESFA